MEVFILPTGLVAALVVLMVACHFIAAYAERKGRSYLGFFIFSFLCLPLGLLAAALAAPNQENIAVSSNLVKCEFCAEYIKREAKTCRFCHKELTGKNHEVNDATVSAIQEYENAEGSVFLIVGAVVAVFVVALAFYLLTKS